MEYPNTLFINLFLSNLVTEVSFIVSVDWAEVNLLKNSALEDMFEPNPQLVIIFSLSKKYSNYRGPDWYVLEKSLLGGSPVSKKIELFLYLII